MSTFHQQRRKELKKQWLTKIKAIRILCRLAYVMNGMTKDHYKGCMRHIEHLEADARNYAPGRIDGNTPIDKTKMQWMNSSWNMWRQAIRANHLTRRGNSTTGIKITEQQLTELLGRPVKIL